MTYNGPMEWPHLERYSDIPMFNTKAVVQQTGIPAPTLRAWERRYSLIAPERTGNAYRLYSQRDIALIHWLKERTDAGMAISHAIALYRHLEEQQHQASLTSDKGEIALEDSFSFQITASHTDIRREQLTEPHDYKQSVVPYPLSHLPLIGHLPSSSSYPTSHSMLIIRDHLIEIFRNMDEQAAHVVMGSVLSLYSIEQVCIELITPTLWHIGELWSEGKLTVSVEHFASNFFRALLTNRFHVTPSPLQGPLAITCSGPGDGHELPALMLALFLRLRGMRVVYLGQSIETTGLIHTIKTVQPTLICISLTRPEQTSLQALINLGRQIESLPPPHPRFVFGGQAFSQCPHIIAQIPGQYMRGDLRDSVSQLCMIMQEQ